MNADSVGASARAHADSLPQRALGAMFVIAAACLPLGMAFVTVSFTLLGVASVLAWRNARGFAIVRSSPTALAALALFAWVCVRTVGGEAAPRDAFAGLMSYHALALLPFLLAAPVPERTRRRALTAFVAGNVAAAAVSYSRFVGLLPLSAGMAGSVLRYEPPQGSIGGAWTMALAAFVAADRAGLAGGARSSRYAAVVALLLGVLFFLVAGRTGYVAVALLAVVLFAGAGWKRLAAALAVLGLVAALAWQFSPFMRERVVAAFELPADAASTNSVGIRLEFDRVTSRIVRWAPLLGTGTGSFEAAFAREADAMGSAAPRTANPHNQYLLFAAETGIPGALLFVALLAAAWLEAARLEPASRRFARGLVLTFAAGCLVNSFLLDGGESRAFALLLTLALKDRATGREGGLARVRR